MLGSILAAALVLSPAVQEAPMTRHATGTFDVSITPVAPAESTAPDIPGRMTLAKTFHGGLSGTGEGEMLGIMGPEQSGGYVALVHQAAAPSTDGPGPSPSSTAA